MLDRSEVITLYKALLGREPESERVIEWTATVCGDLKQAAAGIMFSDEFRLQEMKIAKTSQYRGIGNYVNIKEPTLALAAIVKNEASNIERMLSSAIPVVSFISLVDTGSEDSTIEIADRVLKENAVEYRMTEIEFSDFSYARNIALESVPSEIDWIIVLDADEHLVFEDYPLLKGLLYYASVDAWQLPRYNFVDHDKTHPASPYPDYQKRLFRNRREHRISYVGAVHERLVNVKNYGFAPPNDAAKTGFSGGPHIHHMGQVGLTLERWTEKHEFYANLARSYEGKA